jgi:formylmethanofuran dehydrogenase subunit E
MWVWSRAEGSMTSVDEFDDSAEVECDECGVEFDIVEEGHVEDDDAFCEVCFNNIFGEG